MIVDSLRGGLVAGRLAHNQVSGCSIHPRATSRARGCAMAGAPVGHFPPGPAGPGAHRSTTPEGRSATMVSIAPRPAAHCQTRSARPGLLGAAVPRRGRGQHQVLAVASRRGPTISFARRHLWRGGQARPLPAQPSPLRARSFCTQWLVHVPGLAPSRPGRAAIIWWRRSWRQAPRGFGCSIR